MKEPKYLNPEWRKNTYEKVKSVIESCKNMDQLVVAAKMANNYSNGLWEWRRFVGIGGWAYSDATNAYLLYKIMELNGMLKSQHSLPPTISNTQIKN